jgi:hypothetical protein
MADETQNTAQTNAGSGRAEILKPLARTFTNHGDYFVLIRESCWDTVYNPEIKRLDCGAPIGWTKTHIIITHSAMKGEYGDDDGLQILRFHGVVADNELQWKLASNPYAGVYLTPEEWRQVFGVLMRSKN